jgi:endo-1,4-beta-xylanase
MSWKMMKSIVSLLAFLAVNFSQLGQAIAQDDVATSTATSVEVLRIWPDQPPAWNAPDQSEHDTSKPDSRPVAGKSVIRLGFVSQPELHIYRASPSNQSDTAIVICPGGGYSILAWDLEGTEIAQWLQGIGVTAAVLKYRVPTRNEEKKWLPPVQDIQRSVSLIRSGAVKRFKPQRVGVLGFSAGGNASARAATAAKRLYAPVDDSDQASETPDFAVLVYPAWLVEEDDPTKLIDEIQVTDDTPPMFFAHARDDRITCMGSVTLFAELQRRNIAAALHVFAGGGHGFGARINGTADDHWPSLCESWLRDQGWLKE